MTWASKVFMAQGHARYDGLVRGPQNSVVGIAIATGWMVCGSKPSESERSFLIHTPPDRPQDPPLKIATGAFLRV